MIDWGWRVQFHLSSEFLPYACVALGSGILRWTSPVLDSWWHCLHEEVVVFPSDSQWVGETLAMEGHIFWLQVYCFFPFICSTLLHFLYSINICWMNEWILSCISVTENLWIGNILKWIFKMDWFVWHPVMKLSSGLRKEETWVWLEETKIIEVSVQNLHRELPA